MTPIKFCPRCPESGVCDSCGGPIEETAAMIAKHPQCRCGSPMRAVELRERMWDGSRPYPCHRFAIGCASTYSMLWRDLFRLPHRGPHDFLYVMKPSEVDHALAYRDLVGIVRGAMGRVAQDSQMRHR